MIIFLLALIGTLIIMAILTIGRLVFGRREKFEARKVSSWFVRYFIFNYVVCLAILYFSEPALTGPFWGWQWLVWPLIFSCIGNLFAFARPAIGVLEDVSTAAQTGRFRTVGGSAATAPRNFSRGAVAAAIFGLII